MRVSAVESPSTSHGTAERMGRSLRVLGTVDAGPTCPHHTSARMVRKRRGNRRPVMPDTPTLVVDDEPSIRDLLQLQLSGLGCRVASAGDGRAALEILQAGPIDLVFTDIRMPRM